tara:strand:- start:59584 stop:60021 length:438 start_codon:yes stop_codon:yes gene_type:complete
MTKKSIKSITVAVLALISVFFGSEYYKAQDISAINSGAETIEELYINRQSGVMVEFEGQVIKLLPDDNKGSRHQRFIVKLNESHTVLIAHNIDLAPRVPIQSNANITIYGQYEWNEKGGVVHWTHADPNGTHEGGWIRFQDKVYQ